MALQIVMSRDVLWWQATRTCAAVDFPVNECGSLHPSFQESLFNLAHAASTLRLSVLSVRAIHVPHLTPKAVRHTRAAVPQMINVS